MPRDTSIPDSECDVFHAVYWRRKIYVHKIYAHEIEVHKIYDQSSRQIELQHNACNVGSRSSQKNQTGWPFDHHIRGKF